VVSRGVPYALGMQFVLLDEAALEISKTLYHHLLQGRSIEEAVRRVRRAVEQNTTLHHPQWIAGIPVLYTHVREPAPPIRLETGHATISPDPDQLQETCDLTALPQALHFVGRSQEISDALEVLLKPAVRGFVLLHGLGGIGKTALSYTIAERASWSYRDRVLAVSFETFATQAGEKQLVVSEAFADRFYTRLARFYGLDPSKYPETRDLQDAILQHRVRSHSLLVLDNMETIIEAQKQGDPIARTVATFLSRLQEGDGAILLTSRSEPPADWGTCISIPIVGLSEEASAEMFLTLLPADRRSSAAESTTRQALARRVHGHPLSIRLLAGRFAVSTSDLTAFLSQIEEELKQAEQTTPSSLEDPNRQRTLYACMDYSVTRLTPEQKQVLHACSLFLAPFLRAFVGLLLEDETEQISILLQQLVHLGLLERKTRSFPEGSAELLEMHLMLRWYIQNRFPEVPAEWRQRYGGIYEQLARQAWQLKGGYDQSAWMRFLIRQSLPDCEAALGYLASTERSSLAYHLATPYERMGQNRRALTLYELALEWYQVAGDIREVAVTQNAMADGLRQQGKPQEALALYQESLRTDKELGDVRSIAVTEANLAQLLFGQGEYTQGLLFAWDAYIQLQKSGYVYDAQTMQSILISMKEMYFSQFTLSWTQQIKEEQPDWLRNVQEIPSSPQLSLSAEQRHIIVANTIVVMTEMPEKRAEWHQALSESLQQAQERNATYDAEFFTSLLSLINSQPVVLPPDHLHAEDLAAVERGLVAAQSREAPPDTIEISEDVVQVVRDFLTTKSWEGTRRILVQQQTHLFQPEVEEFLQYQITLAENTGKHQTAEMLLLHLDLLRDAKAEGIERAFANLAQKVTPPFGMELVARSRIAFHGEPTERMAHMHYLTTLATQTTDEGTKKLIEAIQLALVGGDLSQARQDLDGVYRQAWEAIIGEKDAETSDDEPG
jgi:tetratricopeptide (TPR) repeat protein